MVNVLPMACTIFGGYDFSEVFLDLNKHISGCTYSYTHTVCTYDI